MNCMIPPSIISEYTGLLEAALGMAMRAGELQLKYFRTSDLPQATKLNDSDVVTIADKESEKLILSDIRKNFPDHGIISEESGADRENLDWRWIVDPLDGTTNFASGLPAFSVSIALEYLGNPILGVVYAPYLQECFYAVKGAGAWMNGVKIHCSLQTKLSKAVLATGMPYDRTDNPDNNLAEIARMSLLARGIRRLGSAALDLSYTAAGFFDAYWELNLNRWDVAAGILIAKEAGAIVESIRDNRNYSILVSNPKLFPQIRDLIVR